MLFLLICLLRNGHAGPIISHVFPPGTLALPWVLSVVFKCFANIRITDQIAFLCVHAPRGHIYLRFLPRPPPPPATKTRLCTSSHSGNYFRPYLSIPRVCHRGAAYQWKFSYYFEAQCCLIHQMLFSKTMLFDPFDQIFSQRWRKQKT